jgi:hypothetical protein
MGFENGKPLNFRYACHGPLSCSKPLDIEKRAPGYPRSVYQEHPVIQRQNPTSQFSVRLLHKPLLLAQHWAEYKRRLLVIVPANLDQRAHDVPVATQTRLSFDVILPLWGRRGPR